MTEQVSHRSKSWLSKGYGLAPFLLMSDRKVSVGAKALFCYLSSIAGAVINEEFGGRASWPSRSRICRDLDINKDTFTGYLSELKESGYIKVEQRKSSGKFGHNVYIIQEDIETLSREYRANAQINPCLELSDTDSSEPVNPDSTITQDLALPNDLTINSLYSPGNHVVEEVAASLENIAVKSPGHRKATKNLHRTLRRSYPDHFSEFWQAYPRKEDKAMAYEVYQAILGDKTLGLGPSDLLGAVQNFARQMELEGRENRHIKLCKTWLNQSLGEYLFGTTDYEERKQSNTGDPFTFSEELKERILQTDGKEVPIG